jgi:hypothetical protein
MCHYRWVEFEEEPLIQNVQILHQRIFICVVGKVRKEEER